MQFRRSAPDGISSSTNSSSLQQQDMGLIQDRNLPSSPSPSLYSPHAKPSSFMKGGLGQTNSKKQLLSGQAPPDSSRGFSHLVQSITLVSVSIDHCLNIIVPADLPSGGKYTKGASVKELILYSFPPCFCSMRNLHSKCCHIICRCWASKQQCLRHFWLC